MRRRSEVSKGPDGPGDPAIPPADEASAPPLFVEHNAPGGPRMSDDFERIVERVFSLPDALAEYERLEKAMKLGDERTDVGALAKALDESEDNARTAHKLYCNAKVEADAFERDHDLVEASMWAKATAVLQEEKDKGTRNKAITDGDVRAKAAELYPDQYADHAARSAKVKMMVEHAKKLCELWTGRCSSLATLLANRRK